jgi:hypothetical protein
MMVRKHKANTPDAPQMDFNQDKEFGKLLVEELQATTDHQLALRLPGLEIDHPKFVLSSKYATNLGNKQSLGTDEQWDDAKALYALVYDYDLTAQTLSQEADTIDTHKVETCTEAELIQDEYLL